MDLSAAEISDFLWDFREDRRAVLSSLVRSDDGRKIAIQGVIDYLESWEAQDWVDVERIALLGREVSRCCDPDFVDEINSEIKKLETTPRAGKAFLAMQVAPEETDVPSSLPAQSEFAKVATQVESATEESDLTDFENIAEKYVAYFFRTGDYQSVGFSLNRLFRLGQQNANIHYLRFHEILDRSVRKIFSVDATDEYMWLSWAGSYLKLGAFDAAEKILWEAFRRRPDSARIAFGLLKIFERTKYNYQNRIRFANMARKRFHFNRYLELEYARLNGYSSIPDQMKHGIETVLELVSGIDDLRFETVSLASIINKGWGRIQSSGYLQELLESINTKLNQKPKLIAALAYRLTTYHGRDDAAKIILSSRILRTRNLAEKEIFSNTLAKVIAAPGGKQDLTDAVSVLNEFDSNASRNHVAKMLFLRNEAGDWEMAERILRENLERDAHDYYAISQLAGLLMHFGDNRRAEAVSLLAPHASENEQIRELLEIIEVGDFERVDEKLGEKDEELSDTSGEMDPSGLGPFQTWRQDTLQDVSVDGVISRNAIFRKLKFEVEYGTKKSAEYALRRINETTTLADEDYVTFVHSLFEERSVADSSTGSLAAELVRAFEASSFRELDMVAAEVPRLGVVVSFAKAGLGQSGALAEMRTLQNDDNAMAPWERTLVANISNSRFGRGILRSAEEEKPANNNREVVKRMGDLVGAVVTLESLVA